jgi:superfamily I DNA/RNA helicase
MRNDGILDWVSRVRASSGLASTAGVQIMTLEGAKGLQSDVVCVIGLEQGTIPREGDDQRDLAEYSCPMYVSMTRAKNELHLFHSRTRSEAVSFQPVHAKGGPHKLEPSCFLGAIPNAFAERKYYRPRS